MDQHAPLPGYVQFVVGKRPILINVAHIFAVSEAGPRTTIIPVGGGDKDSIVTVDVPMADVIEAIRTARLGVR
jgi:hypothetical protein